MTASQSKWHQELQTLLSGPVYRAYSYSYPHKTAYRTFSHPIELSQVWQQEERESLFLYIHIPFCEMRCGFCNLFTLVRPQKSLPDRYLDALARQINTVKAQLSHSRFSRFAIGGGTPTYLSRPQLETLFELSERFHFADNMPMTIEASPTTVDAEKIQVLQARGVNRISMGVQSFTAAETQALARRQTHHSVSQAVEIIRTHSTAHLNLDLIYGIAGQTLDSWQYSLTQALRYRPEELYLYPLYVREKTGLDKMLAGRIATDRGDRDQLTLYQWGRDFLLAEGYEQVSMRMFRRRDLLATEIPTYSCQQDGMVGLGAGARSYTQALHYSTEYAVGRHGVKDIIEHYIDQSSHDFAHAHYGITLNHDEQKRRFVIQSLLNTEGLDTEAYRQRFGSAAAVDFPQLSALHQASLAVIDHPIIRLSIRGFERADTIGPWLASTSVTERMQGYALS